MRHVIDWPITLRLVEEDGRTEAQLILDTDIATFSSSGEAQRNPADPDVPAIGDGFAAGRALIDLGNRLIRMADAEVDEVDEGRRRGSGPPPVGGWLRD
ncbi:dsRBD fold-containing protein [Catenulispora subtropica]|uniref:DUF1876 domain-containing protein n=1 Tax=Catenulispora subtropica TaxID=450798 RepID=A0ABN2SKZ6_9ACTN